MASISPQNGLHSDAIRKAEERNRNTSDYCRNPDVSATLFLN